MINLTGGLKGEGRKLRQRASFESLVQGATPNGVACRLRVPALAPFAHFSERAVVLKLHAACGLCVLYTVCGSVLHCACDCPEDRKKCGVGALKDEGTAGGERWRWALAVSAGGERWR